MEIIRLRHSWPENAGFGIRHKSGRSDYIFIHFHTPVELTLGGKTVKLKPHATAVFDKSTEFAFRSEQNLMHDWMHFEGDIHERLSLFGLSTDEIYYPKTTDFISDIIRELEVEYFSKKSYCNDICEAKLVELFVKLARSTVLDEVGEIIPDGTRKGFLELRRDIFASLSFDWTVEEMARRVMLSESRFYVIYKQIFGISPKNDLICARVELAKNLLRRGLYSVDEVAEMAGYQSTFNFIRQFKKSVGQTPGEYKRSV